LCNKFFLGTLLWEDQFDFSTSTLCLSPDDSYLAYGFETIDLYQRAGNSYTNVYNYALTDSFGLAGTCTVAGHVKV
jgi:hypothetical protein